MQYLKHEDGNHFCYVALEEWHPAGDVHAAKLKTSVGNFLISQTTQDIFSFGDTIFPMVSFGVFPKKFKEITEDEFNLEIIEKAEKIIQDYSNSIDNSLESLPTKRPIPVRLANDVLRKHKK